MHGDPRQRELPFFTVALLIKANLELFAPFKAKIIVCPSRSYVPGDPGKHKLPLLPAHTNLWPTLNVLHPLRPRFLPVTDEMVYYFGTRRS